MTSAPNAFAPGASDFRLRGTPSPTWVRVRRVFSSTPVLGAALALVTWNVGFGAPITGLDPSWQAGLNMAVYRGLDFGDQIVWTSGPLGFLGYTFVYYGWLSELAVLYQLALNFALCMSLVWAVRHRFGALVAMIATFLALIMMAPVDRVVIITAVWCFAALSRDPPAFVRPLLVFGGGIFSALEIMIKLNPGLTVLVACVTVILVMEDRRWNLAAFGGTFVVTLSVLWFASGQGLSNILNYLETASALVSGYSEAMGFSHVLYGPASGKLLVGAVAAVVILGIGFVVATRGDSWQRRMIVVGLVLVLAFPLYKEAFVRSGAGPASRAGLFYWTMFGVAVAAAPVLGGRDFVRGRRERRWLALLTVVLLGMLAIRAPTPDGVNRDPNPFNHLSIIKGQVQILFSPERRDEAAVLGRDQMRQIYQLDDESLSLLQGHDVHVDSWEAGAVWAYDLDWDPLPVFQDYSTYTDKLDTINAEAVSSPDGPDRILRENTPLVEGPPNTNAIDGRYPAWDPPAATVAMLCNFRALRTTARWQVLARVPNRCGEQRLMGSVRSEFGSTIRVPMPSRSDEVVLARVHGAEVEGLERLRSFVYRARERYATVNGLRRYRLVPGTAADGLLVNTPVTVDFTEPFSLGPRARTILFEKDSGSGDLKVDFYAMKVRPVAQGAPVRVQPVAPPAPKESIETAQARISEALSSDDCDVIHELNPLSRPELNTVDHCDSLKTLARAPVVSFARYRGGAVIDYSSEGRIVTAVLIVDSDGLYRIATLDPYRTTPSVGSRVSAKFDRSARAAIKALRRNDCGAFLEVGLRRLGPDQSPEVLCPYVNESPLNNFLLSDPKAQPQFLGGNGEYAFYRMSNAEVNFTIVMWRQSDLGVPQGSPPLPAGAPEYAYFDAFLTQRRAPVTPSN